MEPQQVIDRIKEWATSHTYGDGDYYAGYDAATAAVLEIIEEASA